MGDNEPHSNGVNGGGDSDDEVRSMGESELQQERREISDSATGKLLCVTYGFVSSLSNPLKLSK